MSIGRRPFALAMASAIALSSLGCGSSPSGPETADVKAGNMPDGGNWTGVYYSQLYGYLHVVQEGSTVSGRWLRPVKDRWGELAGKAKGNVVRFEWTEYKIGGVGPNSSKAGRGYFKYTRPEGDNVDDVIVGEIGTGESEVGSPWDAIKQRNMNPDLGSIGGSTASDIGGGDWDSDNSEEGTDLEGPEELE